MVNAKSVENFSDYVSLKARVELKARRAELNGGLFGINTLLEAHNSHRQEQRCRKMLASQ